MYALRDKEKLNYFKSIVPGHLNSEVIELYYQKYGIRMSKWQVHGLKKTYHLHSNVDTRFQKGCKGSNYHKPIGSERKHGRAGILVKVAEPNVWQLKHRYIYEQHYGKIPSNKMVIFLDGDRNNYSIDNLKLVDKDTHLIAIRKELYSKDKDLTETGILLSELINKNNHISKNID